MTSVHGVAGDEPPIDPWLGQPRMVVDPRISVGQAAEILGKTPVQVYRMVRLGRLRRLGEPNKFRGLLLSDVLQVRDKGEPVKIREAARILVGSRADVWRLVAEGQLSLVPGSQSLLYSADVQDLARTWRPPRRAQRPPRDAQPPPALEGHVGSEAAAQILDRSPSRIRQLAASGRIPAQRDERGHYWFRPDHLEMVKRAWRVRELVEARRTEERRAGS